MVLRLLVGGLSITAIIVFVAAIGGIAGIFYSYPKHMARWPGLTLVVCGITFVVIGLSISSFVGVWESLWCPFVEVPSCNLAIDVASELLSDAANGMVLWSIAVTAVGILALVAARFLPAQHLRGARPPTGVPPVRPMISNTLKAGVGFYNRLSSIQLTFIQKAFLFLVSTGLILAITATLLPTSTTLECGATWPFVVTGLSSATVVMQTPDSPPFF